MKYEKFTIQNYKGIKKIEIDLSGNPKSNIFTFVGLNESGKTTILEAIYFFQENIKAQDVHKLIPKNKQLNFNDKISVRAEISFDENDKQEVLRLLKKSNFSQTNNVDRITIEKAIWFRNSSFEKQNNYWKVEIKGMKGRSKKEVVLKDTDEIWVKIVEHIKEYLLPSIIYYPNFLSDFPTKIYLEESENENKYQKFYRMVLQDVLDSMNQNLNTDEHIIQRIKSSDVQKKAALESTMLQVSARITQTVFSAWGELFNSTGKEIVLSHGTDNERSYVELKLKEGAEQYLISERSLGFKWFFSFLLFTEFRRNRSCDKGEILFLIDEPASNLHSTAQSKLLKTLGKLGKNCKLIYTTHSHHLINPEWLSGAFIIRNKSLNYNDELSFDSSKTDIEAILYKNFISNYPDQRTYFQPILDKLEYQPSLLETVPNIIVLEGKNDFYTFKYINEVILGNKFSSLNFYPGAGAGKNCQIIQLYLSWGRDFAVLMDDDKGGKQAKRKYVNEFGLLVEDKIFTIGDIRENNKGLDTEGMFSQKEKMEIIKSFDPSAESYVKSKFNTALQNLYIDKTEVELSEETKDRFNEILQFLETSKDE